MTPDTVQHMVDTLQTLCIFGLAVALYAIIRPSRK